MVLEAEILVGDGGAEGAEATKAKSSLENGPHPTQFLALYLNL